MKIIYFEQLWASSSIYSSWPKSPVDLAWLVIKQVEISGSKDSSKGLSNFPFRTSLLADAIATRYRSAQ
jgi:hypothetical protein